jgi:phosphoribosyl-AMP cyclohydrolase
MTSNTQLLDQVRWNSNGLVPAIAQDSTNGDILMLAWMNREALARTLEGGEAVYWSRSRESLWHKGESSGHVQQVREIRLDCDRDTVLMRVEQAGGIACHTGRRHCFMYKLEENEWQLCEPVLKQPAEIYGDNT